MPASHRCGLACAVAIASLSLLGACGDGSSDKSSVKTTQPAATGKAKPRRGYGPADFGGRRIAIEREFRDCREARKNDPAGAPYRTCERDRDDALHRAGVNGY